MLSRNSRKPSVGRSVAYSRRARSGPADRARASASRPEPRAAACPRPRPRPLRVTPGDGLSIKTSRREHSHAVTTRPRSLVHPADTRHTLPRETLDSRLASRKEAIITSDNINVTMAEKDWGYSGENGPSTWTEKFPEARGARQSPVDIDTSRISSGGSAPPLKWRYSVNHPRSVVNPGYCWRVDENGYDSELRGGPLGHDVYKLQQWHCHWGAVNGEGSEHTVDGRSFSGELHLVHWNTTKYNSFQEAAGQPDGLAVLGVLLMVGSRHDELDKVIRLLPFITHKNDKVTLSDPLNPVKLLPHQHAYWTYPGSLTTPPCTESVTWILFKQPVQVSAEQLASMRKLKCGEASAGTEAMEVLHNYRPTLPLGNRELRDYGAGN